MMANNATRKNCNNNNNNKLIKINSTKLMPTQQVQVFFPQFCHPEFSKISRIDTRTTQKSQKNWEIWENGPNL